MDKETFIQFRIGIFGKNDGASRRIGAILNGMSEWVRTGKACRRGPYGSQKVYRRGAYADAATAKLMAAVTKIQRDREADVLD